MPEEKLTAPATSDPPVLPPMPGFELLREKGRGPRAVVYKARRSSDQAIFALKLFHSNACDRATAERLRENIVKTAPLQHPGLARSLEFHGEDGRPYLLMEYASGEALSNFLYRRQKFPPSKALSVMMHCARTLAFASASGFTHGRLHPDSIILSRNNARIIGVGMGERPEHASWSVQFPYIFEPLIYTPPEAMPSRGFPADGREAVDIYAIGGMLFHLLAGVAPFEGNDEGSLVPERERFPSPVARYADQVASLSAEMRSLIEQTLAPDPSKRPDYPALLAALTLEHSKLAASETLLAPEPGAPVLRAPVLNEAVPLNPLHAAAMLQTVLNLSSASPSLENPSPAMNPKPTPPPTLIGRVNPIQEHHALANAAAPGAPFPSSHSQRAKQQQRHPVPQFGRSRADRVFSLLLFVMTALVFLAAVLLTAQPFLPPQYQWLRRIVGDSYSNDGHSDAQDPGANASPPSNSNPAAPFDSHTQSAASPVNSSPEDQALAQKQLNLVREMLGRSEILPSPGLVVLLNGIADRSGRLTPTGISAQILVGEIAARVNSASAAPPLPAAPVAAQVPAVSLEKELKTPVDDKPGAKKEIAKKVPEKSVPAPIKPNADLVAAITEARGLMKAFAYVKAKDAVERAQVKADSEQKRILEDFARLLNYEEGVFERAHTTLLDRIKKNPHHESPLQVFPRKDDPVGDDIIDFDDRGLQVLARGGPNKGVHFHAWERIKPAQTLSLLIPLTSKTSLEDQLGLAVFAFNRGLAVETEDALAKAQALPNGKDKAGEISDAITRITRATESN